MKLARPVRNKGQPAFTDAGGLRGLLPPRVCSPAEQEVQPAGQESDLNAISR